MSFCFVEIDKVLNVRKFSDVFWVNEFSFGIFLKSHFKIVPVCVECIINNCSDDVPKE